MRDTAFVSQLGDDCFKAQLNKKQPNMRRTRTTKP